MIAKPFTPRTMKLLTTALLLSIAANIIFAVWMTITGSPVLACCDAGFAVYGLGVWMDWF